MYVLINGKYVHFKRQGDTLDSEKIKSLETKNISVLFVKESERLAYKSYVHDSIQNDKLTSKEKATVLRESSFSLVEEIFEQPDVAKALNESKQVIDDFVDLMAQDAEAMSHLIGLSSHDFYTYNHSLDVSIYALGLGAAAGYSDPKDLADLGQGALLHDLGKRHVDTAIICKKGPLDDNEWAQMKMHPTYGLKIVNDFPIMNDAIKACIFEHHENQIGNGYPQAIEGKEIHPMARIVAICDCYDAMTTKRSYNEPMRPKAVLELMNTKLAGRFDPDMLKAMYSTLFQMEKDKA